MENTILPMAKRSIVLLEALAIDLAGTRVLLDRVIGLATNRSEAEKESARVDEGRNDI